MDKMQAPDGWRVVRLGDVVDVLDARRVPLNADERATMTGAYPYYGANGVVDYIDRWIFDEDDDLVLLAEDGGHFDEFTTKPIAYRVKGKCWVNNHAHVLKANDYTLGNFLFYSLVNKDIRPFINGTTRSKLTQADLRQVEIGLPPLPEQRAIAAVLDSIDEAIKGAEAVITATERLRDALLHELLTRGVPGWHSEWKEAPGIGTIPACWDVVRLGDVAEVRNGTTPSRPRSGYWQDGVVPFVRTGQVHDVTIEVSEELITNEAVTLGGAVVVPEGSVLIAMIGQGKTRGMSARLGIEAAINQNFAAVFGANKDFGLDFLFVWAKQNYSGIRALGQGSNQDALNCALIEGMRVPRPTVAEQRVISAMANCFDDALERARTERNSLHSLKSSASDALLTGHVRVSVSEGSPHEPYCCAIRLGDRPVD